MNPHRRPRRRASCLLTEQRGGALVLALMVLVGLTTVALALLSIGALEPQISRNHVDVVAARYLAEAGIEHAYDALATSAGSWSAYLAGATCTLGAVLTDSTLPGRGPAEGRFTVRLRNDCAPGDDRLTGLPLEADATTDTNGAVFVASTGVVRNTHHAITAVVSDKRERRDPGQSGSRNEIAASRWSDD